MNTHSNDWIRAAVIDRAKELNLSCYAIAKATNGAISPDQVQRYFAGSSSITSERLQHVFDVLGLRISTEKKSRKKSQNSID